MPCKGMRDKCFLIVMHVPVMIVAIIVMCYRTVPYVTLFPWLTDFGLMFLRSVIATESIVLFAHLIELVSLCSRCRSNPNNETDDQTTEGVCQCDTCDNSACEIGLNILIFSLLIGGFAVQTGLFFRSFPYLDEIKDRVDDDLYEWVTKVYGLPDRLSITETINDLQRHEECCGVFDYHDYYNSAYANLTTYGGRVVPLTCFRIPEEGMNETGQEIDKSKIYDEGCFEELIDVYYDDIHIRWSYILVEVFNVIHAIRVACNIYEACKTKAIWRKMKTCCQSSEETSPLLGNMNASEHEGDGQDKNRTTTQKSKSTSSSGPSPSASERQMPQVTSLPEEQGPNVAV